MFSGHPNTRNALYLQPPQTPIAAVFCVVQHFYSIICIYDKTANKGRRTMLRNKIISGLLIAAVAAGITACGTAGAPDGRTGEIVKDQAYGKEGDGNDAAGTGGADDNHADDNHADGTTAEDSATADDPGTTNNNDTQTKPSLSGVSGGLIIDSQAEDYVVFSLEYTNMAWGYQAYKELVLNDGSVYHFRNAPGTAGDKDGRELAVMYLRKYAEPAYYLKVDDLRELYELCRKIDPNVETDRKNFGNDMGSYSFTYYDPETLNEIKIFYSGDWIMVTDDQNLLDAQQKLAKVYGAFTGNIKDIYLSLSTPILNVPYGGKDLIGKNMSFDSYDKFAEFCKKNGIDAENYMTDAQKKSYKEAKCIILQVYDTDRRIDGYISYDNNKLRFLPSLADYEKDPAFEGKVTVAIMRFDPLEKSDYVNENGSPWK